MKYIYTFILLSFFLFSCNSDDDVVCTSEPVNNGSVFIELVNEEGENLIENGTYNPDDITITDTNGNTFVGVVFTDIPEIDTLIALNVSGEDGDNLLEINLSATETDILVLNLTRSETGGICSQRVLTLNSITYNGEVQDIQEDSPLEFLITIVK